MPPFTVGLKADSAVAPEATAGDGERFPELDRAIEIDASDVTVGRGQVPWYRTAATVKALGEETTPDGWAALLKRAVTIRKIEGAEQIQESFEYRDSRWRATYYTCTKGSVLEIRRINKVRRKPGDYGIPQGYFDTLKRSLKGGGLFLVTGPTGSGKTTTLAAGIDYLNENVAVKIQIFDDPIENEFGNGKSWVAQSECGKHFHEWARANMYALRRNPEVIVIGEMLTLEAIAAAVTAAETGHLVMATLHTRTAPGALTRLTDALKNQPDVLSKLSASFVGVLAHRMLHGDGPQGDGKRVVAFELLLRNTAIANLIREGSTALLPHAISTGGGEGMLMLDHSLATLVGEKKVLLESALEEATNPEELKKAVLGRAYRPPART